MKTLKRYIEEGRIYHTSTSTKNRAEIFSDADTAGQVIEEIYRLRENRHLYLLAFVIMPEHLHLLCQPLDKNISLIMRHIKRNSSMNLKRYHGLPTPIWTKRFFDEIIETPESVLTVIEYIHYNPVKAGLVTEPEDYPFSSANPKYEVDWEKVL